MSERDMNSRTIGGTLALCVWMIDKGYGTSSQVEPWMTAIRKVFGTIEGDDYESLDWSALDLDDYLGRFQRIAGADYKAESIVAYGRRVRNAFDAHQHYLDTGRAPTSKPAPKRQKPGAEKQPDKAAAVVQLPQKQLSGQDSGMVTFPYPLNDGRMISITIPPRLQADDVNRVTAFIRTLQDDGPERRQLPPGEAEAA
jgi:hypothetical protein